ncbi:histidine kinase [Allokutzneria sp. A3M-2-11 16]|uniref:sensor histidine kinase n=1 Tax=Allokutzneria sp. A3M-2-11 16 TaxID=2962043 RepID=UPI0020B77940|nr:histidine kinase [Allokutzneria sp. A3M-2-11 16]MCP3804730.1 histidine kinase [Allokutzneria sp. A3M-2-11 16]
MQGERFSGRATALATAISFGCVVATVAAWAAYAWATGGPARSAWFWALMVEQSVEGLAFSVMGALVVTRRPRQPLAWLFLTAGVTASCYPLLSAAMLFELPPWARVAIFVTWITLNFTSVVVFPALALLFPDGRLPGRRWRPVLVALPVVASTGLLIVLASVPLASSSVPVPGQGPAHGLDSPWDAAFKIAAVTHYLLWALCLVSLFSRLRRAGRFARRQIAVALVISVLIYLAFSLETWFATRSYVTSVIVLPDEFFLTCRGLVVLVGLPVLGFVLTRTRLYQLDRAARATVIVVTVIGGLVLSYLLVTALLARVLPGAASWGALVVALATGVAGFGLRDAVRFVRRRVDRAFYGDRAEPYRLLRALPRRLKGVPPNEIPFAVCQTVVSVLRLPAATIEVDGRQLAGVGAADAEPTVFALGKSGRLSVWPRSGQETLDELDIAALEPIVDQTAAVIGTVLVGERLERGVEEERLRLRRDLHDGLGPALAGVALQLGAVRTMVPPRSEAGALLASVMVHMRQIVADFRRVTRNQRPLLLEEHGLRGALVELCRRLSTTETPVTCDLPDPLPGVHEEVVFHVAAESLANAARHAGARSIALRVSVGEEWIVVETRDDGTGIVEPLGLGVGLDSLRERTRAVGGGCEIDSGPGGTTVRALVPLS